MVWTIRVINSSSNNSSLDSMQKLPRPCKHQLSRLLLLLLCSRLLFQFPLSLPLQRRLPLLLPLLLLLLHPPDHPPERRVHRRLALPVAVCRLVPVMSLMVMPKLSMLIILAPHGTPQIHNQSQILLLLPLLSLPPPPPPPPPSRTPTHNRLLDNRIELEPRQTTIMRSSSRMSSAPPLPCRRPPCKRRTHHLLHAPYPPFKTQPRQPEPSRDSQTGRRAVTRRRLLPFSKRPRKRLPLTRLPFTTILPTPTTPTISILATTPPTLRKTARRARV